MQLDPLSVSPDDQTLTLAEKAADDFRAVDPTSLLLDSLLLRIFSTTPPPPTSTSQTPLSASVGSPSTDASTAPSSSSTGTSSTPAVSPPASPSSRDRLRHRLRPLPIPSQKLRHLPLHPHPLGRLRRPLRPRRALPPARLYRHRTQNPLPRLPQSSEALSHRRNRSRPRLHRHRVPHPSGARAHHCTKGDRLLRESPDPDGVW